MDRSCSQLQTSPHCLPRFTKMQEFHFPNKSWKWEVAGTCTGRGFSGYYHHQRRCEMLMGMILCNLLRFQFYILKIEFISNP